MFLRPLILFVYLIFAANYVYAGSVQTVKITGGDEAFTASVIAEDDQFKLVVKATNVPQPLGNLFFIHAEKNGSSFLSVDGSVTAETFLIDADPTDDLIVTSLLFESFANGIKIDKFLSLNSELANGVLVEIKSENEVFQFLPIINTTEFNSHFANGSGRSFDLVFASGSDSMVARFGLANPFILKKQGTFPSNDYIKVIIRDNISSITRFQFLASGAKE